MLGLGEGRGVRAPRASACSASARPGGTSGPPRPQRPGARASRRLSARMIFIVFQATFLFRSSLLPNYTTAQKGVADALLHQTHTKTHARVTTLCKTTCLPGTYFLRGQRADGCTVTPLAVALLSALSVTCSRLWSEDITWKVPEINDAPFPGAR